jgi:DNA-binding MarR family transcriptional regulator
VIGSRPPVMDSIPALLVDPAAKRIYESIELLRILDREMPAQLVSTFLYIAAYEPVDTLQIANATGLAKSSVSRNTDWLSSHHRIKTRVGLGLIVKEVHPLNWRTRICRLTPKGAALLYQIKDQIYGDSD